jgi:RNA polymerase sigma-70 factor (ECF subfamily)
MSTTSISLLARLRRPGDEAAWQRFVALYTPLLYFWARRADLNGADAEDLVQDVFAVLVRELPKFDYDQGESFRGWLRTIAMNRCRDLFRRRGRLGAALAAQADDAARTDGESSDPAQWLAESEYRSQLVGRALELMREEFEEPTWRACYECTVNERAAADVAAELGLTVNAVYVAKSRVLRRLRQQLEGLWE